MIPYHQNDQCKSSVFMRRPRIDIITFLSFNERLLYLRGVRIWVKLRQKAEKCKSLPYCMGNVTVLILGTV